MGQDTWCTRQACHGDDDVGLETQSGIQEAAVEINVRFEFAGNEVWVFGYDAIDFHGDLKEDVALDVFSIVVDHAADEFGTWVDCLVDSVSVTEETLFLGFDVCDEGWHVFGALQVFKGFVGQVDGTTVERTIGRDQTRDAAGEWISQGGGYVKEAVIILQHN